MSTLFAERCTAKLQFRGGHRCAKLGFCATFSPEDVKQEAANEIAVAQLQVAKKEPDKPKMADKLKSATEALEESSKTFESAVKIGSMLGKAILWCGVQWAAWQYGA